MKDGGKNKIKKAEEIIELTQFSLYLYTNI